MLTAGEGGLHILNGDAAHRKIGHPSEANRAAMFESRDRILDQLRAGEDGRAEFKEVRFGNRGVVSPNTEELAGELVAFANAEGGAVFLGVDDSGAVRGIPPARIDAVEHWVLNVATHNCDPPIRPILRKALLPGDGGDDRRVLMAEVPRGLYVHRTFGGRYYARLGSTKRDLTPPELVRLFQQRGRGYVFDEQPVLAAAVDDLNRHRLEAFFGRSPAIPWLDLLRNTRVTYRDEDGVDRPTRRRPAGLRNGAGRIPPLRVHRSRLLSGDPAVLRRSHPCGTARRPRLRPDRRRHRLRRPLHAGAAGSTAKRRQWRPL